MHKYLTLFILSWQNGFVYRTSLFMWRLRQVLSTVMALTIWTVLFSSTNSLFGYDRSQMITYIFLVGILQSFVLATSLHGLANTIYSGNLSYQLLKPVNIYFYLFTDDIADKSRNVFFIFFETVILFFYFQPEIHFPPIPVLILFSLWTGGGILLHFLIQLLFGSVGFWSPDTWGPRFLFFMFIDFTAGKLFPINILPSFIQTLISYTPFPYFSFWQIQLFLQKIYPPDIFQHSLVMCIWIGVLSAVTIFVWKKGLRNYDAAGR